MAYDRLYFAAVDAVAGVEIHRLPRVGKIRRGRAGGAKVDVGDPIKISAVPAAQFVSVRRKSAGEIEPVFGGEDHVRADALAGRREIHPHPRAGGGSIR